jgi:DNA-binding transcriptional ArsR family regulator
MVEHTFNLDSFFGSLADPTRRDMLERIAESEMSVSEIAVPYDLSYAAVSKHLMVLEKARLIMKRRQGKETLVSITPHAFSEASEYLEKYKLFLNQRMDSLEELIEEENYRG